MKIRDRIKELRRVPASELLPNPKNWRTHPEAQANALRGILSEVGIAGAVLARETPAGLMLIDGHLRAETITDTEIPVLILDVTEAEADKLLASYDPLSAMAEADPAKLDELLREIDTGSEELTKMLAELADEAGLYKEPKEEKAVVVAESYSVVIECGNEAQQKEMYDRMTKEGFKCRLLTM